MKKKIFSTTLVIVSCVSLFVLLSGSKKKKALIASTEILNAAQRSLPLLQKSSYIFTLSNKEKCASCHHTSLTSMAVEEGARKGLVPIDSLSRFRVGGMEAILRYAWNENSLGDMITAKFIGPYILQGLAAEKYAPSIYTDIAVEQLLNQARPDGSFKAEAMRVPFESGEMHLAAMSIRAIQLYVSPARAKKAAEVTANARRFFENAAVTGQQEIVFQLLGLQWTGADPKVKKKIAEQLLAMQRSDGGWAQLPTLRSDAYATGQALYALYKSESLHPEDEAYQKAMAWLLRTQEKDGSWYVSTRSYAIQPFSDGGFYPGDESQFISAAATAWVVMDLLYALPDKK